MRATKLQFSHLFPISSYHAIELPEFANVRNLNGSGQDLYCRVFSALRKRVETRSFTCAGEGYMVNKNVISIFLICLAFSRQRGRMGKGVVFTTTLIAGS